MKNVKRLLGKLGKKTSTSSIYKSTYYQVNGIRIRCSDHFSDKPKNAVQLDIVKSGEFYIFRDCSAGFSVTLESKDIVKYIRAYLTVYSTVHNEFLTYRGISIKERKKRDQLQQDYLKLKQKIDKNDRNYAAVDSIIRDKVAVERELNRVKNELNNYQLKVNSLNQKLSQIKDLVVKK